MWKRPAERKQPLVREQYLRRRERGLKRERKVVKDDEITLCTVTQTAGGGEDPCEFC
jgi:hypothetical protein